MRRIMTILGVVVAAGLAAAIVAGVVAPRVGRAVHHEPLPVYYHLPTIQLVDQDGRPWSSESLQGKIWVADFMFTRCNGICPMQSHNMQALQDALRGTPLWDRVRLVSISVDAENDTPAVLREYAQRYRADPTRWTFLTGPKERVWSLSQDHFKLHVSDDPDNEAMPIQHAGKFVLIDGQARVRAYHDGTDPQGREALIADLKLLAAEPD